LEAEQCIQSWLKNGMADGHAASKNIAAAVDDHEFVDIADDTR